MIERLLCLELRKESDCEFIFQTKENKISPHPKTYLRTISF